MPAAKSPEKPRHRWNRRILLRYTLLQLPALALLIAVLWLLASWFELPRLWLLLVLLVWIIKDIALFPLVWRSYDPEPSTYGNTLVGRSGRVVRVPTTTTPEAMVEINGELWRARVASGHTRFETGALVRVTAMHGLRLDVVVESPATANSGESAPATEKSSSPPSASGS